jgi:hypothetical protein
LPVLLVVTLALFPAAHATSFPSPSASIQNGSFESAYLPPWQFQIVEGTGITALVINNTETTIKHGIYAAVIRMPTSAATQTAYLYQEIDLTDVSITEYVWSGWFKANSTGYKAHIEICEYDKYGAQIGFSESSEIDLTTDWQKIQVSHTTNNEWKAAKLEIRLVASGSNGSNVVNTYMDLIELSWVKTFEWQYPYLSVIWNNTQNTDYVWTFSATHPMAFSQLHPVVVYSTTSFNFTNQPIPLGGSGNGTWTLITQTTILTYHHFETVRIKYDSYVGPVYSTHGHMNASIDQYTVRLTYQVSGLSNVTVRLDESFYPYKPQMIQYMNAYQLGNVTQIDEHWEGETKYPPMCEVTFRTHPLTYRQDIILSWSPSGYGSTEVIAVAVGTAAVLASGVIWINRRRRARP